MLLLRRRASVTIGAAMSKNRRSRKGKQRQTPRRQDSQPTHVPRMEKDSSSLPDRPSFAVRNWRTIVAGTVILLAGVITYSNSFSGPYIFDDTTSIPENPHIRSLWPIWEAMKGPSQQTVDGRPILCLSLAINYQISKLDVWSYHLVNLLIHLGCGMLLYGIVRRTLLTGKLVGTFARAAWPLALVCAVLWLVHPLNTGSVTYIVQRAESLMGLFYLLTLYLAIRGWTGPKSVSRYWFAGSVAACAIGMGCKEVMFTAPILLLIYDMVFIAPRPAEALSRRWRLYASLAATWAILAALVAKGPRHESVGFGFDISPWDYAATQCNVIIHYLKLCFWPTKLSLDYDWPIARELSDYSVNGAMLLVLLAGVAFVVATKPKWGFLGLWVFLILGPTSSFLPIATEVAAEHRMYLPLIGPVVAVVLVAYFACKRLSEANKHAERTVMAVCLAAAFSLTVLLGAMTHRRNIDYRSRISIWQDVTEKLPANARGHHNLGVALSDVEEHRQAVEHYEKALAIRPTYVAVLAHRGASYNKLGEHEKALADFKRALELDPHNEKAIIGRGVASQALGQLDEAIDRFKEATVAHPNSAIAWSNLGSTYDRMKDYEKALECFNKAIEVDPAFINAWVNRGLTRTKKDLWQKAIDDYSQAIRLDPNHVEAHSNRATAHQHLGDLDKALADFTKVIELDSSLAAGYRGRGSIYIDRKDFDRALADYDKLVDFHPDDPESYVARGNAYGTAGRTVEAINEFLHAIDIDPESFSAHSSAAIAYRDSGNFEQADKHFGLAIRLRPESAVAHNNRGISRGKSGKFDLAIEDFTKAIELDPNQASAYNNRGMAWGNQGKYAEAIADFTQAIEIDPTFATPHLHMAMAKEGLGDRQGALASLKSALRLAKAQNQQRMVTTIQQRIKAYEEQQQR